MGKFKVLGLIVGWLALTACHHHHHHPEPPDAEMQIDRHSHPEARAFRGQIISLRPARQIFLVSTGEDPSGLNVVECHFNRQTVLFLDGRPANLTDIQPYMNVHVRGHMEYPQGPENPGLLMVEVAKFSSVVKK